VICTVRYRGEYKWALEKNPYLMEAVEKLARLGCNETELARVVDEGIVSLANDGRDDENKLEETKADDGLPEATALREIASV
jgi:hypothetical protein